MTLTEAIRAFLRDIRLFSRIVVRRELRGYQLAPARAIVDSVIRRRGLTFAVVMSRQAGKNELSAQLEAYLMNLFQQVRGATLVKASPTYKPQTLNSKLRLLDALANPWNARFLHTGDGHVVRLGHCRCAFFSAQPGANVVGATASVLLECDEAQDVDPAKWDKDFAPMAASTNATTVFYGTLWSADTLLSRVIRQLRAQEAADGVQRVFIVPWDAVAEEVPAYGAYVRKEIVRLGHDHPIVKTQYLLEEIAGAGKMLGPERLAMMRGTHLRQRQPTGGTVYALTVDVAGSADTGEDEALRQAAPRKDSTVATMFAVDLTTCDDPRIGLPVYRTVNRWRWTGRRHEELYAALSDIAETWRVAYVVVDATGVGGPLAEFLQRRLGAAVVRPFTFTQVSKSELAWAFLAAIGTGRYKEYAPDDDPDGDTAQFWREAEACVLRAVPGAGHRAQWGAPDATTHDDCLVSAALVATLDAAAWRVERETVVLRRVEEGEGSF